MRYHYTAGPSKDQHYWPENISNQLQTLVGSQIPNPVGKIAETSCHVDVTSMNTKWCNSLSGMLLDAIKEAKGYCAVPFISNLSI